MTDDECNKAYQQLIKYLRSQKMAWLADAIEEEVRLGRDEEIKVKTYTQHVDEKGQVFSPRPSGAKASFLRSVQYTGQEKLVLTIDAIEETVIATAYMERDFFKVISDTVTDGSQGAPTSVSFIPSQPQAQSQTHEFSQGGVAQRVATAERLQTLLDQLRKEI
tara:strand:+ start:60 stop:548 length:489 start_codon:yes stop_codon:yes gene_type:complete